MTARGRGTPSGRSTDALVIPDVVTSQVEQCLEEALDVAQAQQRMCFSHTKLMATIETLANDSSDEGNRLTDALERTGMNKLLLVLDFIANKATDTVGGYPNESGMPRDVWELKSRLGR